MLSPRQLARISRLWGPLMFAGTGGFIGGIVTIACFGIADLAAAFAALSASIASLVVCVIPALALVAIASPFVLKQEQHRTLLARNALNNMTQGLSMFDASARLVLCNVHFIEMYRLQRSDLWAYAAARDSAPVRRRRHFFG